MRQPQHTYVRMTRRQRRQIIDALACGHIHNQDNREARSLFVGPFRPMEIDLFQLGDGLNGIADLRGPLIVFVEGPPGAGKSVLASALYRTLATAGVSVARLGEEDDTDENTTVLLAEVLSEAVVLRPDGIVSYMKRPLKERLRHGLQRLRQWIRRVCR